MRPSLYNKNTLKRVNDYIKNYENYGDVIPSIVGLSSHLKVSNKTIYNWSKVPENHELLHALGLLKSLQHRVLLNKGLKSEFNAAICKLMLMNNHGYSEKQEVKSTGNNSNTKPIKEYSRKELLEIINKE